MSTAAVPPLPGSLESIFEHVPAGIAVFDRGFRLVRCNRAWAEMVANYSPLSVDDVKPGMHAFDIGPGTEEGTTAIFERVFAGETVREAGYRTESRGIVSYWDVVFAPWYENGEVRGVIDVTTDATARVLAEQATQEREQHVAESEAELKALFGAMDDLIFVVARDGSFVSSAPTNTSSLIRSPERLPGRNLHDLLPPAVATSMLSLVNEVLASGERRRATYTIPIREREVTFDAVVSPMTANTALWVARDITAEVQAQAAAEQSELQFRSIFEETSDAVIINDVETGRVVEANPAALRMHGYTHDEFIGLHPSRFIHPDSLHLFHEFVQKVQEGREFRARAKDVRKDGTVFDVEVMGVGFRYGGKLRSLAMVRDISDQVAQLEQLEQLVEERTRDLATLLDASRDISAATDLRGLLVVLFDQLKRVIDYTGCTVVRVDGDQFEFVGGRSEGRSTEDESLPGLRFPIAAAGIIAETILRHEPVIIDDVRGEGVFAEAYRGVLGPGIEAPSFRSQRTVVMAPLVANGQLLGALTVSKNRPAAITPREVALIMTFANQAAVAIANARLLAETKERSRDLATLLDVSRDISATTQLEPLLTSLLDQLKRVIDYTGCSVMMLRGAAFEIIAGRAEGSMQNEPSVVGLRFPVAAAAGIGDAIYRHEPVVIDNVRGEGEYAQMYRNVLGAAIETRGFRSVRAIVIAPLVANGRLIGALSVSKDIPGAFGPREVALIMTFANQAAVALENARLHTETATRARELATLLEVSRDIALSTQLDDVTPTILDQLQRVIDYTGASVMLFEGGEEMRFIEDRTMGQRMVTGGMTGRIFHFASGNLVSDAIYGHRPVLIGDVHGDDELAVAYREIIGAFAGHPSFQPVVSLLLVPLLSRGQLIGMLGISNNVPHAFDQHHVELTMTFANQAAVAIENARLYQESRGRALQLATLLEVSRDIASTTGLEDVMRATLDQLQRVIPYRGAGIWLLEDGSLHLIEDRTDGVRQFQSEILNVRIRLREGNLISEAIYDRRPVVIDDIRGPSDEAVAYRDVARRLLDAPALQNVCSAMIVPLVARGRLLGALTVSKETPSAFGLQDVGLATTFANQAAVAIENARLYSESMQRSRELATLLEVSRDIASSTELDELTPVILEQLRRVVPFWGAAVLLLEGEGLRLIEDRAAGSSERVLDLIGDVLPLIPGNAACQAFMRREVSVIDDVRGESPEALAYREWIGHRLEMPSFASVRNAMLVPLVARGQLTGLLTISMERPGVFGQAHVELTTTFANQAAVAIENARLYSETAARTRELTTLLGVSRAVSSTMDLDELIKLFLDRLRDICDYTAASINVNEDGAIRVLGRRGPAWPVGFEGATRLRPLASGPSWEAITGSDALIIDDVRGDTPDAQAYRRFVSPYLETHFAHVRAWMAVPLVHKGEAFGYLNVAHSQPGYFTQELARLIKALADQVAVVIQNARLFTETDRRAKETAALLDVARAINASQNLDELIGTVLDRLKDLFRYTGASVNIIERGRLRSIGRRGPERPPELTEGMLDRASRSPVWSRLTNGEPVLIDDILGPGELAETYREFVGQRLTTHFGHVRAWMAVPLMDKGRPFGYLSISSAEPRAFSENDLRLAMALSDQIAVAIQNSRLFAQTEQRARELSTLLQVAQAVNSTLELDPLLRTILDSLKSVLDYDAAFISLVDGEDVRTISSIGAEGYEVGAPGSRYHFRRDGAIAATMRRREAAIIRDVLAEDDELAAEYREMAGGRLEVAAGETRSWMGVPLIVKGRTFGVLSVTRTQPNYFTREHARLAMTFANGCAIAIDNANLFGDARRRAAEIQALYRADEQLHRSLALEDVLDALSEVAIELLGADRSMIVGWEGTSAIVRASRGYDAAEVQEIARVISSVFASAPGGMHTLVVEDAARADAVTAELARATNQQAFIEVPLRLAGEIYGVFGAGFNHARRITNDEVRLFESIAQRAAIAIENARLFGQAQRRAREMEALAGITATLNFEHSLEETLNELAQRIVAATDGTACSITLFNDDGGYLMSGLANLPPEHASALAEAVAEGAPSPAHLVMSSGKPWVFRDVRRQLQSDPRFGRVRELLADVTWDTFAALPLRYRGRALGTLEVYYEPGHEPDDADVALLTSIAGQTAVAVDNARLFAEAGRRARETEALYRADEELHRSLDLDVVLEALVGVAVEQLQADGAAVFVRERPGAPLMIRANRGGESFDSESLQQIVSGLERLPAEDGATSVCEDTRTLDLGTQQITDAFGVRSFLQTPLELPGMTSAVFVAAWYTPRRFDQNESRLFQTLARRAALALENARLYARAQDAAALEERQRLARELHDSVSQALYGIALGARTARTLLDRDPARAVEPVDYVLQLAEAGLAEMRALIFELRPESLESEGLVAALDKQVAATRARYGIDVDAHFCDEPDIPIGVKEALFRIGQEALHNTVKHARASVVHLDLLTDDGQVTITVRDNGQGFDPGGEFPGHLGLKSMRERAERLGGQLRVSSCVGHGTLVRATIPV